MFLRDYLLNIFLFVVLITLSHSENASNSNSVKYDTNLNRNARFRSLEHKKRDSKPYHHPSLLNNANVKRPTNNPKSSQDDVKTLPELVRNELKTAQKLLNAALPPDTNKQIASPQKEPVHQSHPRRRLIRLRTTPVTIIQTSKPAIPRTDISGHLVRNTENVNTLPEKSNSKDASNDVSKADSTIDKIHQLVMESAKKQDNKVYPLEPRADVQIPIQTTMPNVIHNDQISSQHNLAQINRLIHARRKLNDHWNSLQARKPTTGIIKLKNALQVLKSRIRHHHPHDEPYHHPDPHHHYHHHHYHHPHHHHGHELIKQSAESRPKTDILVINIPRESLNKLMKGLVESGNNVKFKEDPCLSSPCLNGGKCHRDITRAFTKYTCTCFFGYDGLRCQKNVFNHPTHHHHTSHSVILIIVGIVIAILSCCLIHACRVWSRRSDLKYNYKNLSRSGLDPPEVPTNLQIWNQICLENFCGCFRHKGLEKYDGEYSPLITQKEIDELTSTSAMGRKASLGLIRSKLETMSPEGRELLSQQLLKRVESFKGASPKTSIMKQVPSRTKDQAVNSKIGSRQSIGNKEISSNQSLFRKSPVPSQKQSDSSQNPSKKASEIPLTESRSVNLEQLDRGESFQHLSHPTSGHLVNFSQNRSLTTPGSRERLQYSSQQLQKGQQFQQSQPVQQFQHSQQVQQIQQSQPVQQFQQSQPVQQFQQSRPVQQFQQSQPVQQIQQSQPVQQFQQSQPVQQFQQSQPIQQIQQSQPVQQFQQSQPIQHIEHSQQIQQIQQDEQVKQEQQKVPESSESNSSDEEGADNDDDGEKDVTLSPEHRAMLQNDDLEKYLVDLVVKLSEVEAAVQKLENKDEKAENQKMKDAPTGDEDAYSEGAENRENIFVQSADQQDFTREQNRAGHMNVNTRINIKPVNEIETHEYPSTSYSPTDYNEQIVPVNDLRRNAKRISLRTIPQEDEPANETQINGRVQGRSFENGTSPETDDGNIADDYPSREQGQPYEKVTNQRMDAGKIADGYTSRAQERSFDNQILQRKEERNMGVEFTSKGQRRSFDNAMTQEMVEQNIDDDDQSRGQGQSFERPMSQGMVEGNRYDDYQSRGQGQSFEKPVSQRMVEGNRYDDYQSRGQGQSFEKPMSQRMVEGNTYDYQSNGQGRSIENPMFERLDDGTISNGYTSRGKRRSFESHKLQKIDEDDDYISRGQRRSFENSIVHGISEGDAGDDYTSRGVQTSFRNIRTENIQTSSDSPDNMDRLTYCPYRNDFCIRANYAPPPRLVPHRDPPPYRTSHQFQRSNVRSNHRISGSHRLVRGEEEYPQRETTDYPQYFNASQNEDVGSPNIPSSTVNSHVQHISKGFTRTHPYESGTDTSDHGNSSRERVNSYQERMNRNQSHDTWSRTTSRITLSPRSSPYAAEDLKSPEDFRQEFKALATREEHIMTLQRHSQHYSSNVQQEDDVFVEPLSEDIRATRRTFPMISKFLVGRFKSLRPPCEDADDENEDSDMNNSRNLEDSGSFFCPIPSNQMFDGNMSNSSPFTHKDNNYSELRDSSITKVNNQSEIIANGNDTVPEETRDLGKIIDLESQSNGFSNLCTQNENEFLDSGGRRNLTDCAEDHAIVSSKGQSKDFAISSIRPNSKQQNLEGSVFCNEPDLSNMRLDSKQQNLDRSSLIGSNMIDFREKVHLKNMEALLTCKTNATDSDVDESAKNYLAETSMIVDVGSDVDSDQDDEEVDEEISFKVQRLDLPKYSTNDYSTNGVDGGDVEKGVDDDIMNKTKVMDSQREAFRDDIKNENNDAEKDGDVNYSKFGFDETETEETPSQTSAQIASIIEDIGSLAAVINEINSNQKESDEDGEESVEVETNPNNVPVLKNQEKSRNENTVVVPELEISVDAPISTCDICKQEEITIPKQNQKIDESSRNT